MSSIGVRSSLHCGCVSLYRIRNCRAAARALLRIESSIHIPHQDRRHRTFSALYHKPGRRDHPGRQNRIEVEAKIEALAAESNLAASALSNLDERHGSIATFKSLMTWLPIWLGRGRRYPSSYRRTYVLHGKDVPTKLVVILASVD